MYRRAQALDVLREAERPTLVVLDETLVHVDMALAKTADPDLGMVKAIGAFVKDELSRARRVKKSRSVSTGSVEKVGV